MRLCVLSRFSGIQLFATLWSAACQAPLSTGLSRQEYWSGLPCPPPGDFPDPRIEPVSLTSPASGAGSSPLVPPGKPSETTEMSILFEFSITWLCFYTEKINNKNIKWGEKAVTKVNEQFNLMIRVSIVLERFFPQFLKCFSMLHLLINNNIF